jgi:hypothetical protein
LNLQERQWQQQLHQLNATQLLLMLMLLSLSY